ncbi:hypothetical protein HDU97_005467 [Phlyctochytrium planicorne]|nr:hypothetical protein HDU97_005467 [Phlyctochytrium planicorne]
MSNRDISLVVPDESLVRISESNTSSASSNASTIVDLTETTAPDIVTSNNTNTSATESKASHFVLKTFVLPLLILLAILDISILTTSLPAILSSLSSPALLSWVGSANLLSSTVSTLLFGRLSDAIGRKWAIVVAVSAFAIGGGISSLAPGGAVGVVLGRAITGFGGGGVLALAFILVGDVCPSMQAKARYQGALNATSGIAQLLGPLLGGIISDRLNWRYSFLVSIIIAIIVGILVLTCVKFPSPVSASSKLSLAEPPQPCRTSYQSLSRLDFSGLVLILTASACLITPIQMGGTVWDWNDFRIYTMLAAAVAVTLMCVWWECYVAKEPLIPVKIKSNQFQAREVTAVILIAFFLGYINSGYSYYLSLFFQMANDMSATLAGLQQSPLVFGIVLTAIVGGQIVSRTRNYAPMFFIGPILSIIGIALTSTLDATSSVGLRILYLFIAGIGIGSVVTVRIVAIQTSVEPEWIAVGTALTLFSQMLGGMIGISVTGAIFNNILLNRVSSTASLLPYLPDGRVNFISLRESLPTAGLKMDLIKAFVDGFAVSYRSFLVCPLIILVLALVFIRRRKEEPVNHHGLQLRGGQTEDST